MPELVSIAHYWKTQRKPLSEVVFFNMIHFFKRKYATKIAEDAKLKNKKLIEQPFLGTSVVELNSLLLQAQMSDSNEMVQNLFLYTGGDKWVHHRRVVAIAISGWHVHIRTNWRSLLLLFTYIPGKGKFI